MLQLNRRIILFFILIILTIKPIISQTCFESTYSLQSDNFSNNPDFYCSGNLHYYLINPTGVYNKFTFFFYQVDLYDGETLKIRAYDPLNPSLTGSVIVSFDKNNSNNVQNEYVTCCNALLVEYYSQNSMPSSSWEIDYAAVFENRQVYNYTNYSGIFDDGSASQEYDPDIYYKYLIKPTGADFLEAVFTNFQLGVGDSVNVYDGENEYAPLLGSYSEYVLPSVKLKSTDSLLCIIFKTNNYNEDSGWDLEYLGYKKRADTLSFFYNASGNLTDRTITIGSKTKSAKVSNITPKTQPQQKIEENMESAKIHIYPNPTRGQLKVDITGYDLTQQNGIYIYNLSGTILHQVKPVNPSNIIDLSNDPNGTYIMRVIIGNKTKDWKIVKE